MEYSNLFVVLMGMGTVFFGLICIVLLIAVMGKLIGKETVTPQATVQSANPKPAADPQKDALKMQELVAVITCALAYELDANPRTLSIMSIKKL